jgi:hypothetical protein
LALTVAASLPQSVKRVYAINPYDYEALRANDHETSESEEFSLGA